MSIDNNNEQNIVMQIVRSKSHNYFNKKKKEKRHTVETILKYNRKIVETVKIDTSNTQIYMRIEINHGSFNMDWRILVFYPSPRWLP